MKIIKFLLRYPIELANSIYNHIIFKLSNSKWDKFPVINGKVIRRGSGLLRLGQDIIINSNETKNPVGLSKRTLFYVAPSARIIIGNNVGISTSLFYAKESIEIENDVLIGGGCQFLDNDFHPLNFEDRIQKNNHHIQSAPILIKEGAFIGTSSIILKGVTIGKKSILAAGSVISKSVPDGEIWGGNPAKFIKKITE